MNPVNPACPPHKRPGLSALPVTLTESPTESMAVTLQVPVSPWPDCVIHDWHRISSFRTIRNSLLSWFVTPYTERKYVPFSVGVNKPKHKKALQQDANRPFANCMCLILNTFDRVRRLPVQ